VCSGCEGGYRGRRSPCPASRTRSGPSVLV